MYLNQIILNSREIALINLGLSYYTKETLLTNLNESITLFDSISKDIFMEVLFETNVTMFTQDGSEISTIE